MKIRTGVRRTIWQHCALILPWIMLAGILACESAAPDDGTNSDATTTTCTPGETKAADDGCNTCTCMENAEWACTLIACPPDDCEPEDCGGGLGMPNFECPDGITIAGPGDCKRNDEGICAWEIIECPAECTAGEKRDAQDGCNTCECTADGTWACTEEACPPSCGPDDCGPPLGMPNYECPDGETMAGPGDCILKEDGQCGWEIIECPAECTAGETKDAEDGCNTCECTADGTWACTEMACPKECGEDDCGPGLGMPNYLCPDGVTMAGPGDCILQDGDLCGWEIVECPPECAVGETKDAEDGCNTCECTADGTWACTDMVCPACEPDDCGPKPGMPNKLCPDGKTMSGPGDCVEQKDGSCGWEMIVCPDECPPFECPPGQMEKDSDKDGCNDTCEPSSICPPFKCPVGETPVDTDNDGCNDTCEPKVLCPLFKCSTGEKPIDTDKDGCNDACETCTPIACLKGQKQVDTDKDGCPDKCYSNCPAPPHGLVPERAMARRHGRGRLPRSVRGQRHLPDGL